jgi:type VII secretion-associated serine protease mycosin
LVVHRVLVVAGAWLLVGLSGAPARADLPPGTRCDPPPTRIIADRPWAQQRLGFERVWPLIRGGGVLVGVVDTGVDGNQPLLRGHVLPGADVKNGGVADTDCVGHGTLVAGIIAGQQETGIGFAGVAPDARVFPVRQANTTSDGTTGDLANGIDAAVAAGARVINVSIVSDENSTAVRDAVANALAHDVVLVAAAGNDFGQGNPTEYPAAYPGVLAVGAIDASDHRAQFSGTDSNVAVVAPGSNITGPGAGGNGLVTAQNGTSYATPYVAGVAALVRAYHPELTAAQVIHRIEVSADHPATSTLPDPQLGWGVVNPYAAVTAVLPEEHGAHATTAPVRRLSAPVRPAVGHTPLVIAMAAAGAAVVLAGLIVTGAMLLPRGRRRGWRPGNW